MGSRRLFAASAVVLALALSGCGNGITGDTDGAGAGEPGSGTPTASVAEISASIAPNAKDVKINRALRLDVARGTFGSVSVTAPDGAVAGQFSPDKLSWQSTGRLQPGQTYQVHGVALDESGVRQIYRANFSTQNLSLDQQTFPSFVPTDGATVGVGMPVIVRFDVPVTDHASFQRHLHVTSVPAQAGSFHWISDSEVHWRPRVFWKAGSTVTVDADLDSVPAGDGIYGQKSRKMTFNVGHSMISKVNMDTHQMQVFRDGKLLRTIPITTGAQPKYTTRSGTKVIMEKFRHKRMNSETIGIDPNSADGYDLDNVEYAMRVTYSGEFIHAAPWSVGSQGHSNVSHGCTGLSTANAQWLYENTQIGDVVEYTGTEKPMTLTNGYGDWTMPFNQYRTGSAL